ncbi:CD276 antigen homolog [Echeneis naucrates]|uniref:CD276 antigen homolog n=1 Tax=Echeneis naucrates TaxID=173247 RepID=UPI001113E10C|nr:CD276 antigen homolog [Echeneis naucrates]
MGPCCWTRDDRHHVRCERSVLEVLGGGHCVSRKETTLWLDFSVDIATKMLFLRNIALIWTLFNIPAVSCLTAVKARVGADVLLSCVHPDVSAVPQNMSFLWMDQQSRVLMTSLHGAPGNGYQHEAFRGRVASFPGLSSKGNFSVVLQTVQKTDSNNYTCIVPQLNLQQEVMLTVSGVSPRRPWTTALLTLIPMSVFFGLAEH